MKSKTIHAFLPPLVYDWLYRSPLKKYGWFGNYPSWEVALKDCNGYDTDEIISRVTAATLKVKIGEAVYERDSVLFDRIDYDWQLLAGLMWVTAQHAGTLNVLDFGGSLGSTYFQNRKFLSALKDVKWNIVEQAKFVKRGQEQMADDRLKFYGTIEECLLVTKPQVLLLSSVLSYIQEPYTLLDQFIQAQIPFLIIDRLPLINQSNDRLTVQRVSPHIYPASYPAWFFSQTKFMHFIEKHFEIVEEYNTGLAFNIKSEVKGLILRLKTR